MKSNNASIDFQGWQSLYHQHAYYANIYFLIYTVIVPTEGPCATNNGGCDQICTDESGFVQCYCEAGYFSIAFLPTKCFGESRQVL